MRMKTEGRTATDQLLVAVSIQDALKQLDLQPYVQNKRIFFQVSGHSTEIDYIAQVVPALLLQEGAMLVTKPEEADSVLTFVVDSAGSDQSTGGWGFPILLPSLTVGFIITTIDLIQTEEQIGLCRLWVFATDAEGQHLFTSDPSHAQHSVKNLKVLGLSLGRTTDVDELRQRIPLVDIPIP